MRMPIMNEFRECTHGSKEDSAVTDWRECYKCLGEVTMQLTIARTYLKEIAEGKFNDNGIMTIPVAEPLQGRDFQQIAATGLGACSD